MFRFAFPLLLALTLSTTASAEPDARGLVAVLPFDAHEAGLTDASLQTLEEAVRTVAGDELKPRGFTVLTGETTLAVLSDNGVDAAKACEASCALEAARQLKAKLFIAGSIAKSEGEYVVFVRLFENEHGTQLASVQLEGATVKDLRHQFADKGPAFFAKALGDAAPAAPRPAPERVPTVTRAEEPPRRRPGLDLRLQLDAPSLDGLTAAVVQRGGARPCAHPLVFGVACRLSGLDPGTVDLELVAPGGEPQRLSVDVSASAPAKAISYSYAVTGRLLLLTAGLGVLGAALTYLWRTTEASPSIVGVAIAADAFVPITLIVALAKAASPDLVVRDLEPGEARSPTGAD